MITVQIATLPDRDVVPTIYSLYDQVDKIVICFNGHKEIPFWAKDIRKIESHLMDNSLGDAAKFFEIDKKSGYLFTCDDDLIYPDTYVQDMIEKIEEYHCPVSLHGRCFDVRPIKSYYHSATKKYRCLGDVSDCYQVDVGGTGVMAWRSDMLKISIEDFPVKNMADIWFAKLCHEQGVNIICVKHPAKYLGYIHPISNIYDDTNKADSYQTQIINTFLT